MSVCTLLDVKDNLKAFLADEAGNLRNIFKMIFLFLGVSSLYIGFSGFCATFVGFILLGVRPNLHACIAVFLAVFSVYSLNKLTDRKEDAINFPERLGFLAGRTRLILVYSLMSYALSVLLIYGEKSMSIPVIFIPLLANSLYSCRLIPGLPRLKDIPFMKNLVVAFSWALVCVLIPAAYSGCSDAGVILIIYFMTQKYLINTILYDIRDVAGDRENGIRTVPCLLGPKKTLLILLAINSTLLPLLALTEGTSRLLIGGMIVYGYVYILHFSKKQSPLSLDLVVDGEWMLACILIMLLSRMGTI